MQDNPLSEISLPARVALRDGRQVVLRKIREEDKAGLLAAFDRLSADSRYTRFMASLRELPEAMLESATHPAPELECALVAIYGDAQSIVGGARYAAAPGSDVCEFAVTIDDEWHGLGLARCLMQVLIAAARARGYRTMEGYVLASNTGMRGLARRLGFVDTACHEDATLRVVSLGLTGAAGAPAPG
ncbi:N-acetyltransferase family protein [Cupriavidus basilensis]|uniref:GNAT family N-acetyltransferase n=1 Tax=Cupriavidus TaxID=106589 RepID=UPI0023E7D713|nr:GNAT family N-acetyltransferase [Cupriavidus basilensis]MDF3889062.1 GNAT family N-acetyltransferase [Cupriavidus basilensis]